MKSKSSRKVDPTQAPPSNRADSSGINARELFRKFAYRTACWTGTPAAFLLSCVLLLAWIVSGPFFHFSDTWQLVINTSTTIVTFLMVFLVQATQNRDAKAIHLKLDELIRSIHGARNRLVCLESLSEDELDTLEKEFAKLRDRSQKPSSPAHGKPKLEPVEPLSEHGENTLKTRS